MIAGNDSLLRFRIVFDASVVRFFEIFCAPVQLSDVLGQRDCVLVCDRRRRGCRRSRTSRALSKFWKIRHWTLDQHTDLLHLQLV